MKRLKKHCAHVNLESCPIAEAKVFLRDAIYEELNMQLYDGAQTCHSIHPTWKPLRWQREMKSKLTVSWYYSVAVGRGRFKSRRFEYAMCDSPACRFCGNENETVKHIIFRCSRLSEAQGKLQKACKTQGVDFTLQNLFTNFFQISLLNFGVLHAHIRVEKFTISHELVNFGEKEISQKSPPPFQKIILS